MQAMIHKQEELPIACDLTAIPLEERAAHAALAEQLFGEEVLERRELPDGYQFRFRANSYERVVAFIANERLCCPFFHFTLEVPSAREPICLAVTGSAEVKAFVASAFV